MHAPDLNHKLHLARNMVGRLHWLSSPYLSCFILQFTLVTWNQWILDLQSMHEYMNNQKRLVENSFSVDHQSNVDWDHKCIAEARQLNIHVKVEISTIRCQWWKILQIHIYSKFKEKDEATAVHLWFSTQNIWLVSISMFFKTNLVKKNLLYTITWWW